MDLDATIDIIIKELSDVREIIDDLKSIPGVPDLQVELAKAKCKTASDVIALLKRLPQVKVTVKEQNEPAKEHVSPVKIPAGEVKPVPDDIERAVVPDSKSPVTRAEPDKPKEVFVTKEDSRPFIKKPVEQSILADQFSDRAESFNEKIGSLKHEDDVLDIMKSKPVASLSEAIGVNDKFLFIREIFDGNHEAYLQAIGKLESVVSLTEARSLIMEYTGDPEENEAVKQLLDLIKRKLPANE